MGELGIPELLIILAIIVVLFGPSRLAGLGKSLGSGIREFRTSIREGSEAVPTIEQPSPNVVLKDPVKDDVVVQ